MKFDYDKSADVLYVTVADRDPSSCRFPENDNGDVLWVDKSTGETVGVTIIKFLLRVEQGYSIDVPEIGSTLPLKKQAARLLRERKRA